MIRATWGTAAWNSAGWAVFGLAYVGAVVLATTVLDASPGAVVLVLVAGSQLSQFVGAAVGELGFLRSFWLDISRRLMWLEDYAAAVDARSDGVPPERLRTGIRLDHVTFAYPGTDRAVLDDVSLDLPAGVGGRRRRRERRRQDHAGQAAGPALRPGLGPDRGGRRRPGVLLGAGVARAPRRCLPGLRALRAARAGVGRRSASSLASATAPRSTPPSTGPGRATSSTGCPGGSAPSSARRGTTGSRSPTASGRSSRWPAASCATSRCCWCSTSRRPPSTPRPSTRSSSGSRPPPAAR